jgi:hypothetical protein
MNGKRLRGKDGELVIAHNGVVFAYAGRFEAQLAEVAAMNATGRAGVADIVTGYKATLRLDDVMVTDDAEAEALINDLNNGIMPELGFCGKFRRADGMAERIVFTNCALAGELDLIGLARGSLWEMRLAVNRLTDGHIRQFQSHGE